MLSIRRFCFYSECRMNTCMFSMAIWVRFIHVFYILVQVIAPLKLTHTNTHACCDQRCRLAIASLILYTDVYCERFLSRSDSSDSSLESPIYIHIYIYHPLSRHYSSLWCLCVLFRQDENDENAHLVARADRLSDTDATTGPFLVVDVCECVA